MTGTSVKATGWKTCGILAGVLLSLAAGRASADEPVVTEGLLDAPVAEVWRVWTTSEGLQSWLAPHVDIDLRVGGKMRTNYRADGRLGDENTIENTILSFEPLRMLSIKATKAPADFPFKAAIADAWSVLYFEPAGPDRTRFRLIGMRNGPETEEAAKMREFFRAGNAWTFAQLQTKFAAQRRPRVETETVVDAPLADVWTAWTTTEGVKSFFGQGARVELCMGGPFEVYFDMKQPAGQRGSEGCRVLAYQPMRMLAFTWNAPPKFAEARPQHTQVVLLFDEIAPARTRVRLTQHGFGDGSEWNEVHAYFSKAWPSVLEHLRTHFATKAPEVAKAAAREKPQHFLALLRPKRATFEQDATKEEMEHVRAHFVRLKKMRDEGSVILAGPSTDGAGPGVIVFEAVSDAAAKEMIDNDPAVKAGVFLAEVHPYRLSLLRTAQGS